MRRGETVFFMWKGLLNCSPILKMNRSTVTVAVSDGERMIPKGKILPRIGPCRDPLALWFLEFLQDGRLVRTYHEDRRAARKARAALKAKDGAA